MKRIIDQTGAKIVMSSSWRHSGLGEMQRMWEMRDLPGKLIDVTPDVSEVVDAQYERFYDKVCRGHEIQYWLDRTSGVTNYVIIDDDNDMLSIHMDNFVRTANNYDHEGHVEGYGLTRACADAAIAILNKYGR